MHEIQRYFTYASVAISPEEASESVAKIMKDYRIQGDELKGKNLIKFNKGRHAIDEVFKLFNGRAAISISDKKYALAGKFFEYIFEPAIAEISGYFYASNFHLFIANILYLEFKARGAGAEEIFTEFEALMRDLNGERLATLFSSSKNGENSLVMRQIRDFALSQQHHIGNELKSLRGSEAGKWVLDLTGSALAIQLGHWGLQFDAMVVVCDESKPLAESPTFFDAMIGKKEKTVFIETPVGSQPMTFNLAEPIRFRDSKLESGIQIADVLASGAAFAASNPEHTFGAKWLEIISTMPSQGSVLPDSDYVDLTDPTARRNAMILSNLHHHSMNGGNIIESMKALFSVAADLHTENARVVSQFRR